MTIEREGRAMKAMAPVFDMFNHDPSSSTVHGFQESNQVRPLSRETDGSDGRTAAAEGVKGVLLKGPCLSGKRSRPLLLLCPCLHPLARIVTVHVANQVQVRVPQTRAHFFPVACSASTS